MEVTDPVFPPFRPVACRYHRPIARSETRSTPSARSERRARSHRRRQGTALTWLLWSRLGDRLAGETTRTGFVPGAGTPYNQADFWGKGIGVVTPHRAQQAMVNRMLQSVFLTHPAQGIRDAVDTVERFQGQERDVIIATFAMGDADAIGAEDEFLLSLNRFNVMASRARAKLVVLIARELVDHLSSDADVLRGSALLKTFVETFCDQQRPMQLGFTRAGAPVPVAGSFRWRR